MFFRHCKRWFGAFLLVPLAFSAAACHHRQDPEEKAEWITKRIAGKLDLNADQNAKLDAVKDEVLAARKEMRKDRDADMDFLMAQITAAELDQAKLNELVTKHTRAVEQRAPQVIAKLADFHKSLNAEQKKELAEKAEDFKGHWRHH